MNVIIRVDASVQIGSGHVVRCLTIAKKLHETGCHVQFWMEPLEGNLIELVAREGFSNITSAKQADLYIIDHYQLDKEWEQSIRIYTKKIAVIDDLAREHDCDLLLDQNAVSNFETRYDGKVPEYCIKLLGPKYLIMRDEFIKERKKLRKRDDKVGRLLVFMGGTDPTNETMKVLLALEGYTFEHVDIVVGNGNPQKKKIEESCKQRGYHYHCQIGYMAKLMQQADFAIGTGGSSMWERCYVGLPSSATIVADNQSSTTIYAEQLGIVKNLGWHEQVTTETYKELLVNLSIMRMSERGLQLTANDKVDVWLHEFLHLNKRIN